MSVHTAGAAGRIRMEGRGLSGRLEIDDERIRLVTTATRR
jgi:hypothetical protein